MRRPIFVSALQKHNFSAAYNSHNQAGKPVCRAGKPVRSFIKHACIRADFPCSPSHRPLAPSTSRCPHRWLRPSAQHACCACISKPCTSAHLQNPSWPWMHPPPPVVQLDLEHILRPGVNAPHASTVYAGVRAVCVRWVPQLGKYGGRAAVIAQVAGCSLHVGSAQVAPLLAWPHASEVSNWRGRETLCMLHHIFLWQQNGGLGGL